MNRDAEQLERLASEAADATLSAAERAQLEKAAAADPQVRTAVGAYARLAARLKAWRALPTSVDLGATAQAIHDRIESQTEFTMSQYADGALNEADARAAALRFSGDANAMRIEREHRQVQELLDQWGTQQPAVDWSAMQARISAAVRREAATAGRRRWLRLAGGLAVAASVVVAALVGFRTLRGRTPGGVLPQGPVQVRIDRPDAGGVAAVKFDESAPEGIKNPNGLQKPEERRGVAAKSPARGDEYPGF